MSKSDFVQEKSTHRHGQRRLLKPGRRDMPGSAIFEVAWMYPYSGVTPRMTETTLRASFEVFD